MAPSASLAGAERDQPATYTPPALIPGELAATSPPLEAHDRDGTASSKATSQCSPEAAKALGPTPNHHADGVVDKAIIEALQTSQTKHTIQELEGLVLEFIDEEGRDTLEFPANLGPYAKMLAHRVAQAYGLQTQTVDFEEGPGRVIGLRGRDTHKRTILLTSLDVSSASMTPAQRPNDRGKGFRNQRMKPGLEHGSGSGRGGVPVPVPRHGGGHMGSGGPMGGWSAPLPVPGPFHGSGHSTASGLSREEELQRLRDQLGGLSFGGTELPAVAPAGMPAGAVAVTVAGHHAVGAHVGPPTNVGGQVRRGSGTGMRGAAGRKGRGDGGDASYGRGSFYSNGGGHAEVHPGAVYSAPLVVSPPPESPMPMHDSAPLGTILSPQWSGSLPSVHMYAHAPPPPPPPPSHPPGGGHKGTAGVQGAGSGADRASNGSGADGGGAGNARTGFGSGGGGVGGAASGSSGPLSPATAAGGTMPGGYGMPHPHMVPYALPPGAGYPPGAVAYHPLHVGMGPGGQGAMFPGHAHPGMGYPYAAPVPYGYVPAPGGGPGASDAGMFPPGSYVIPYMQVGPPTSAGGRGSTASTPGAINPAPGMMGDPAVAGGGAPYAALGGQGPGSRPGSRHGQYGGGSAPTSGPLGNGHGHGSGNGGGGDGVLGGGRDRSRPSLNGRVHGRGNAGRLDGSGSGTGGAPPPPARTAAHGKPGMMGRPGMHGAPHAMPQQPPPQPYAGA